MRSILLLDNGSRRPEATLNLRRLAGLVAARCGEPVLPVSLLHADGVPPARLDGQPAATLAPTLRRLLDTGTDQLVVLPLFFGPSQGLSGLLPDTLSDLASADPPEVRLARELCPLPGGEPRLLDILEDHVRHTAAGHGQAAARVVLVDHGSPTPTVTAVRRWLAAGLAQRLGPEVALEQAVMERRGGSEYDFNGPLLEDLLQRLATADSRTPVILAMLFLSAGRHAGAGGDIDHIRAGVMARHPGLQVLTSPLVGSHPALVDILLSRLAEAERSPPFQLRRTASPR